MSASESPPEVPYTSVQLEIDRGDIAIARRLAMQNACTVFDPVTNTYQQRSVRDTTIAEIGDYGVGLQLYFEFLKKVGIALVIMAVLAIPVTVFSYNGDFGGFTAGFFAKTTIGNIGVCGQYGELCPEVTSYPYRLLLATDAMLGAGALLRSATPYFGAISAVSTIAFSIFLLVFYYWMMPKMERVHDEKHITPTDYAVEVDLLPRLLDPAHTHVHYEALLTAHFEKVAGQEGSVAEVALARDYGGGIRKFLSIHELTVELNELNARAKRCSSEKHELAVRKRISKLEAKRDACVKAVAKEAVVDETARPVCKAFVVFTETKHRDRVIEAYSWTSRTWLFRKLQPEPLRFGTRALRVKPTTEPANVYQENLDLPRKDRCLRKALTVAASVVVLAVAMMLLLVAQTYTRTGGSIGVGEKPVWVVANATAATGTCFETCGFSFYSDPTCETSVNEKLVGIMDSSGVYTPGGGSLAKPDLRPGDGSTCTLDSVWRSDRCVSVQAWNGYWRPDGTPAQATSIGRRLSSAVSEPGVRRQTARSPTVRSTINSDLPPPGGAKSAHPKVGPYIPPIPSSTACPDECPNAAGPNLHMCMTGKLCDGVWSCIDGSDELRDGLGNTCSALCTSLTWANQCPVSGRCINAKSGSCFTECLSHQLDPTCSTVKEIITERAGLDGNPLDQCEPMSASRILAENFGGDCLGGFASEPCCSLQRLSDPDRRSLASCSAASVFDDVTAVWSDMSALTYMDQYCRSYQRAKSRYAAGRCQSAQLWLLQAVSPSCWAAVHYNRGWCECLADLVLLPAELVGELESCTLAADENLYLGANAEFNHLTQAGDVMRLACQREQPRAEKRTEKPDTHTDVIVAAFLMTGAFQPKALEADMEELIGALETTATIIAWVQVTENVAAVRLEVNDRTPAGDANVLAAYNGLKTAIDTKWPYHDAFRQRSFGEPHCGPESHQCFTTRKCIPSSQVCDGIPDCAFPGDDENKDVCEPVAAGECRADETKCSSGDECVPFLFWCDGLADCSDGSDETSAECLVQRDVRAITNSTSELANELLAMEYLAFHFSEPVSVQCVVMDQPTHSLATVVDVYACENEVVFRPGDGAVMRFPDLNCVKVQTAGIRPPSTSPNSHILSSAEMVYSVFQPVGIVCTPGLDHCPLATGSAAAFCLQLGDGSGVCKYRVAGSVAAVPVTDRPVCDLGSPISPQAAELIRQSYLLEDGVTVNETIVTELTYRCFCEQQIQYQSDTNSLLAYPPYDTGVQVTCEVYFRKQLRDAAIGLSGVAVVAVLNALLSALMYRLADAERAPSLTDRASAELWKLFLAQFINTALLVLLVNAKFYDSGFAFAGLGDGEFVDTTREWFVRVGANICVTVLILVATSTVPALLLELFGRWWKRRSLRQLLTQEAMNEAAERSEFSLSLRLAQMLNVVAVVTMYASAMPMMLWIGVLYCAVAFWFDKFVLLRYSKLPPQFSAATMKICLRLMPIAIVLNAVFMVWTMSSQTVFPSDVVQDSWSAAINDGFDENSLILYITGRLSFDSHKGAYAEYIRTRVMDSFRKASFGGIIVLCLVALFFSFLILRLLWQYTVMLVYKFIGIRLGWVVTRITARVNQLLLRLAAVEVEPEGPPTFADAKHIMDKNRLLSSYRLSDHPKYAGAYRAITHVRRQSFNDGSESSHSHDLMQPPVERLPGQVREGSDMEFRSQPDPQATPPERAPVQLDDVIEPESNSAEDTPAVDGSKPELARYPSLPAGPLNPPTLGRRSSQ